MYTYFTYRHRKSLRYTIPNEATNNEIIDSQCQYLEKGIKMKSIIKCKLDQKQSPRLIANDYNKKPNKRTSQGAQAPSTILQEDT